MEFEIEEYNTRNYYISLNGAFFDHDIADMLGLTLKEYSKILESYNAIRSEHHDDHEFLNREDARAAIDKLESIYIMNTLTND